MVATVRRTRKLLPKEMCGNNRDLCTEFIYHEGKFVVVRFTEKRGKSVTLLSSQHHVGLIDENNNKPEIVNFYNATKAGVDTLDQLVRLYTVRRKTKRWPLVIFYNMLDIACYNSLVICCEKFQEYKRKYNNRVR